MCVFWYFITFLVYVLGLHYYFMILDIPASVKTQTKRKTEKFKIKTLNLKTKTTTWHDQDYNFDSKVSTCLETKTHVFLRVSGACHVDVAASMS